ncbi:hypothetical protein QOT17_004941 [Balamuthia mandrillaris]
MLALSSAVFTTSSTAMTAAYSAIDALPLFEDDFLGTERFPSSFSRFIDDASASDEELCFSEEGEEDFTLLDLPLELVMEVFTYLSGKDLAATTTVCRDWHALTLCPLLWRRLVFAELLSSAVVDEGTVAQGTSVSCPASAWKEKYRKIAGGTWDPQRTGRQLELCRNQKQVKVPEGCASSWRTVLSERSFKPEQGSKVYVSLRYNTYLPPPQQQEEEGQTQETQTPPTPPTNMCVGFVPAPSKTLRLNLESDISCVGWSLWRDGEMRRWPLDLSPSSSSSSSSSSTAQRYVTSLPEWKDGDVVTLELDWEKERGSLNFLLNGKRVEEAEHMKSGLASVSGILDYTDELCLAVSLYDNTGAVTILSVASTLDGTF